MRQLQQFQQQPDRMARYGQLRLLFLELLRLLQELQEPRVQVLWKPGVDIRPLLDQVSWNVYRGLRTLSEGELFRLFPGAMQLLVRLAQLPPQLQCGSSRFDKGNVRILLQPGPAWLLFSPGSHAVSLLG